MSQTVPNQRTITVNKEKTDKQHLYTTNNLAALDEAAGLLQSKAGFKLYLYLAKNQNYHTFALSSQHFCEWAGVGIAAYNSAFEELKSCGYLIPKDSSKSGKTQFSFFDKRQQPAAAVELPEPPEEAEIVKSDILQPPAAEAPRIEPEDAEVKELTLEQVKQYWLEDEYTIDEKGFIVFNKSSANYGRNNIKVKA